MRYLLRLWIVGMLMAISVSGIAPFQGPAGASRLRSAGANSSVVSEDFVVQAAAALDPAFHILFGVCPVPVTPGGINAGDSFTFAIPAGCGIPASVEAVSISLWAVDPIAEGNLRIGPSGGTLAGAGNFGANGLENVTSLMVPLSVSGELDLAVNGGPVPMGTALADGLRVEIVGWFGADMTPGLAYHPVDACAFYDSRANQGSANPGPHPVGTSLGMELGGGFPAGQGGGNTDCGVPNSAEAVLVNFVLIQPTGEVGLMALEALATVVFDEPMGVAFNNGTAVVVPVAAGDLSVELFGPVGGEAHVRAQVLGYYDPVSIAGGLEFVAVDPCVVFDSRANQGATGGFVGARVGDSVTTYDVVGSFDPAQGGGSSDCGIPTDAEAVELSLVGVNAVREGNLRVSAAGVVASGGVLNFGVLVPKMNNSNAVVVPVSPGGAIDVFVNGGPQGVGLQVSEVRGITTGYYILAAPG